MTKPLPRTKRWWSQELNIMRKKKNQLANTLFCWRGTPDYPSHLLHKKSLKDYVKLIETTKKEHWENELLNTSEKDIWMANKYTTDAPTDGSKTRMTTLNFVDKEGDTHHTTSNAEKSTALAKSLFPPPPTHVTCDLQTYSSTSQLNRSERLLQSLMLIRPLAQTEFPTSSSRRQLTC